MLAQGIIRDIEDWEDVIIVFAQVERVRYFSTIGSHFAQPCLDWLSGFQFTSGCVTLYICGTV